MNYEEYKSAPQKYELFKTGALRYNLFCENSQHEKGILVRLEFDTHAYNRLFRRIEPLYWCDTINAYVYGSSLDNFCL